MKFSIYGIIMRIFQFMALIGSALIVIYTDWKDIEAIDALYVCGSIGGVLFLEQFFRKEADDTKGGLNE